MSFDWQKGFEKLKQLGVLMTTECIRCDGEGKICACGKPAKWKNANGYYCDEHKP